MEIILKPNEKQMETLSKVSEITGVDYDGLEWNVDITPDRLLDALADMVYEYHKKEEEIEDLQSDEEREPDYYKEWRDNNESF